MDSEVRTSLLRFLFSTLVLVGLKPTTCGFLPAIGGVLLVEEHRIDLGHGHKNVAHETLHVGCQNAQVFADKLVN